MYTVFCRRRYKKRLIVTSTICFVLLSLYSYYHTIDSGISNISRIRKTERRHNAERTVHYEAHLQSINIGHTSSLNWLKTTNKTLIISQEDIETNKAPWEGVDCPGFYPYQTTKSSDILMSENKEFSNWMQFQQNRAVEGVNCNFLINGNTTEQKRILSAMRHTHFDVVPPSFYLNRTTDCQQYISETGFITSSLTEEEENFPIAYSIVVYKHIEQVERLLRSIYRPQNVYCIHCDKKADDTFKQALRGITSCFDNVFMSTRSISVTWGDTSCLTPDMECMKDLWRHKKWKYFINLTGQEFPLRTNLELVRILKTYNGANNIEGTVKRALTGRWNGLPPPPHSIRPIHGSVHIVANRRFVEYILFNKVASDLFNWTKNAQHASEIFFNTLNYNPHLNISGSYKGVPETDCKSNPFLTRFKNWGPQSSLFNWPCHGTVVRDICIFGVGDLPLLSKRPEMFANKFFLNYQPYTLKCLDQLMFNRTRDEYFNGFKLNIAKYRSLDFIKNAI
ncbi:beta-1,3-galactosyl-O-glycosyl-glycoprotein beta-1,6-N-acetylglucosaminyltransferase-like [Mytilus edulis]|uniref:beta-1,3-galactosyl-O-glycosyl-glycoprotein beta-1,6-N-acetylglucosaminyltransferase-like n=1 Tax=Mytilus edulis TaxID=6550 RepID=UPI0039EEF44C